MHSFSQMHTHTVITTLKTNYISNLSLTKQIKFDSINNQCGSHFKSIATKDSNFNISIPFPQIHTYITYMHTIKTKPQLNLDKQIPQNHKIHKILNLSRLFIIHLSGFHLSTHSKLIKTNHIFHSGNKNFQKLENSKNSPQVDLDK